MKKKSKYKIKKKEWLSFNHYTTTTGLSFEGYLVQEVTVGYAVHFGVFGPCNNCYTRSSDRNFSTVSVGESDTKVHRLI